MTRREWSLTVVGIFGLGLLFLSTTYWTLVRTAESNIPNLADPLDIGTFQLVAMPERFQGRAVRVKGFLHFEFEGNTLYSSMADYLDDPYNSKSVWVQVGWPPPEEFMKYNDRAVVIEATYTAHEKGHMGMFAGSLQNITRIEFVGR